MKKINRSSHPLNTIQPISNTFFSSSNSHKSLPYFPKPIKPLPKHPKSLTKLHPSTASSTLIKSHSSNESNTICKVSKRQFYLRDQYKSHTVKHFNKTQPEHKQNPSMPRCQNDCSKTPINSGCLDYFSNNSKGKINILSIDNQNEAVLCIQKHWKKYLLKKMGIIQSTRTLVTTPQCNDEIVMIYQKKSKTALNSGSKGKNVKSKISFTKKKHKCKVINKDHKKVCDGLYKIDNVFKNKTYRYKIEIFQKFKELQLISQLRSKFTMRNNVFSKSSTNNRICTTTMNNIVYNSNSNSHISKRKDIDTSCKFLNKTKLKSKAKSLHKLHINPISS